MRVATLSALVLLVAAPAYAQMTQQNRQNQGQAANPPTAADAQKQGAEVHRGSGQDNDNASKSTPAGRPETQQHG